MKAYFRRCFAYDHWANRELLQSLQSAPQPPARAVAWLGHFLLGQEFVLEALAGRYAVQLLDTEDPTLQECTALVDRLARRWEQYFDRVSERDLAGRISMRGSSGQPREQAVPDLLTHALFHSMYHRGQIAVELRAHGGTPALIDVTVFARHFPHP